MKDHPTTALALFTATLLAACSATIGDGSVLDAAAGATRDAVAPVTSSADGGALPDATLSSDAGTSDSSSDAPTEIADGGDAGGRCGAGDPNLPPEPTIPPACATVNATQAVSPGQLPSESSPDTAAIQAALDGCAAGHAVRLVAQAGKNALLTGPLTLPAGVTLWVDSGVTLYATRDPNLFGSAPALILAKGAGSGVVGDGVLDGQGGELRIGADASAWDVNGGGGQNPALVEALGATNFVLYRITLHDAPMFHAKIDSRGFIVWGVTVETPSRSTNSAGTALSPSAAHNTDGIDPGESAQDGYIVCNQISDGDDHIAIKGAKGVKHLVVAHNRLRAGHGMSIGSEINGGVSDVHVYDMTIDGLDSGLKGGSSNGIRIKSDPSRGGPVTNVLYEDVCMREIENPILVSPHYSTATGTLIPSFQGIVLRGVHAQAAATAPTVTVDGYDTAHETQVTFDGVTVDGITAANVKAAYAQVTLGPGPVNFAPSGTGVTVVSADGGSGAPADPCAGRW